MRLRPYQLDAKVKVEQAWASGAKNVLLRMPTGGGKTPTFSQLLSDESGASVVIAHRAELVTQSSLALARYGVRHRIIGPDALMRQCVALHMAEMRRNFIDPNAKTAVAGIDTLVRMPKDTPWFGQVRKWVVDEGHHLQAENKWGRGVSLFPNALGLAVTATPGRPDGCGLSRESDGLIDVMVHGPEMRELIDAGYLTPYRIYCPPSDVDISGVSVTASGEFSHAELSSAVHKSKQIVGDVVSHYLKLAPGKLGITFAVDVAAATEIAAAFRAAGVPAEVITGNTPPLLRANIMQRFRSRDILQLVNVDLLGEGVDVPAVEVVSMARHTNSFITYAQQFGRMLRLFLGAEYAAVWDQLSDADRRAVIAASDKPFGILLDHVGNVVRHNGPPDRRIEWSLDRRERRSASKSDAIPYRICVNPNANGTGIACDMPYERTYKCCPHCGYYPVPVQRSAPEHVDGDLIELDDETLALLRGEINRIDGEPVIPFNADYIVAMSVRKRHAERQEAQRALVQTLAWYGGFLTASGVSDLSEQWRRFYFKFGTDVATARTLNAKDAEALRVRVHEELLQNGIDAAVSYG